MTDFTTLPIAVGCSIICEWINWEDLVRLDSAYCNHLTRSAFLIYCNSGTLEMDQIWLKSAAQIQWIINRKLKFRKFSTSLLVWQQGIDKLIDEMFASIGDHVKEVQICPDSSLSSKQIVCLNAIIAQNCMNIRKVEVAEKITDMEIAPLLCVLRSIQFLYIYDCNITNASLYIISNICAMNLRILFLDGLGVCDSGITALVGKCPELEELHIRSCFSVTGKGLAALILTTPKLNCFRITICDLSDTDITTLAQHCPMLHTLEVNATLLTDVGIQELGNHCTQLRKLDLNNCMNISTGFSLFQNLEELRLYCCPTLTDTMVATIVQNNPLLENLTLEYCKKLTSLAVLCILDGCPELRNITITNTTATVFTRNTFVMTTLIKQQYPNIFLALINLA